MLAFLRFLLREKASDPFIRGDRLIAAAFKYKNGKEEYTGAERPCRQQHEQEQEWEMGILPANKADHRTDERHNQHMQYQRDAEFPGNEENNRYQFKARA